MLIVVLTEYCPAGIQRDSHFLSTVLANKAYSSFSSFVRITFLNAFITFLNIIQIQYSRSAAGCILHLSEFEISYNETKFWSHIWRLSLKQNVFSSKTHRIVQKHIMVKWQWWLHADFIGISMTQPLCQGRTQWRRFSNNIRTELKTHNFKMTIEVQWLDDQKDYCIFDLLESNRFLIRLWKCHSLVFKYKYTKDSTNNMSPVIFNKSLKSLQQLLFLFT